MRETVWESPISLLRPLLKDRVPPLPTLRFCILCLQRLVDVCGLDFEIKEKHTSPHAHVHDSGDLVDNV